MSYPRPPMHDGALDIALRATALVDSRSDLLALRYCAMIDDERRFAKMRGLKNENNKRAI